MNEAENLNVGHRARLRERFLLSDSATVTDAEVLELLLFLVQPRKDVKPIAKRLLKFRKTFAAVMGCDLDLLRSIKGVGDSSIAMFKVIHESVCRVLRHDLTSRSLLNNIDSVVAYCRSRMGYLSREQTRVLFLNQKNYLITDEVQHEGTIDHTSMYPRELMRRCLQLGAGAMILVHNHPSGDSSPSSADVEVTKHIFELSKMMNIALHDHIIITSRSFFSFRQNNLF